MAVLNIAGSRIRRVREKTVRLIGTGEEIEKAIYENVKIFFEKNFTADKSETRKMIEENGPKTRFEKEMVILAENI